MRRKTAGEVRAEAARLAADCAAQRERDYDPEGVGVLRELARDIRGIRISGDGAARREEIFAEAARRWPDIVTHDYEPPPGVPKHPLGKIVEDRGPLRFAFATGALWALGLSGGEAGA